MNRGMDKPSRVALMTGGARGLGRVMALALLASGHRVAILVAALQQPGAAERLSEDAVRVFGRIDMLFNNAGLGSGSLRSDLLTRPYRFWENERGVIEKFFAVNTVQAMILAARLTPAMIAQGWGRIVCNTTSLDTMLKQSLYGATKAALEAETAVMARDLSGTGVTANVLVPGGGAGTRMTDVLGIPRDVLIDENVMAAPAIFLASEDANEFTARRIIASRWRNDLPPGEAAAAASDPIAWKGYGTQGTQPAITGAMTAA